MCDASLYSLLLITERLNMLLPKYLYHTSMEIRIIIIIIITSSSITWRFLNRGCSTVLTLYFTDGHGANFMINGVYHL